MEAAFAGCHRGSVSLGLGSDCYEQSYRSQSASRHISDQAQVRATGIGQAQMAGSGRQFWMRREAGTEAREDTRVAHPPPLPQAGIQTPATPKAPLLGAAWHSPVRDTLGPFSLQARLSEVSGEEGSVWAARKGPGLIVPTHAPSDSLNSAPTLIAQKANIGAAGRTQEKGAALRDIPQGMSASCPIHGRVSLGPVS